MANQPQRFSIFAVDVPKSTVEDRFLRYYPIFAVKLLNPVASCKHIRYSASAVDRDRRNRTLDPAGRPGL